MSYPQILKNLLDSLQKLPGIGPKTAERLAFHLLKAPDSEAFELADAIRQVKENLKKCRYCFHITDEDPCAICSNPQRDTSIICVVEQSKDLMAIEKTGQYKGLYHVLMGRVAPLEDEHPESLTIDVLVERIQKSLGTEHPVKELIIATNPTLEGDTTSLYIIDQIKQFPITISKIARGIPVGTSIEFANDAILSDALNYRKPLKNT